MIQETERVIRGELVPVGAWGGELARADDRDGGEELLRDWLSARKESTRQKYSESLGWFADWLLGEREPGRAVELFLSLSPGEANRVALRWRAHMIEKQGLSGASVNLRLSALRSLVSVARRVGRVYWSLDCEGVKVEPYRDTRGPGVEGVRAMFEQCSGDSDLDVRDRAMLWLLYGLALRRGELVSLDLDHVDLAEGRVAVLGKGRQERETLTLPPQAVAALADWIERRGDAPGPLFPSKRARGGRLHFQTIQARVRELAKRAGLSRPVSPHRIRHASITAALDQCKGDVRSVRKFSRHAKVETLLIYDDRRTDVGGEIARQVAAAL